MVEGGNDYDHENDLFVLFFALIVVVLLIYVLSI